MQELITILISDTVRVRLIMGQYEPIMITPLQNPTTLTYVNDNGF